MADDKKQKAMEKKEKWFQSVSSVLIGLIFVVIGIPLWWHTTKVYRASLPYQDIEMLADLKLSYKVPISVVIPNQETTSIINTFKTALTEKLQQLQDPSVIPRFDIDVRFTTKEELSIIDNVIANKQSVRDLDSAFHRTWVEKSDKENRYTFLFVPSTMFGDMKDAYIGRFSNTLIPYNKGIFLVNSEVDRVSNIIRDVYININALKSTFSTASKKNLQKNDIESIRAQKSVSGYQISFTLLNADPQSVLPQWDIKQAVTKFLNPFLKQLYFLDTSIDSQVIHYSSLEIKPKKKDNMFYLRYKDLPHLINPIEAKLGSYVSLNSNLNFIVYVPSQKHTPLYIKAKNGKIAESNAFLSPQWGGFVIYNINKTSDNNTVQIDMDITMNVFISQLKLLLGIKSLTIPQGCSLGDYSRTDKWEQVSLLRTKTIEYLTTSTITLTSLARLLEQISNMVIGDQIQAQVQQSLGAIHKSKEYLDKGKVTEAFLEAKTALVSSEKAFFDPSILALLYFPDDQKYAIYIPLFLPIGIPILMSLISGIKWLKSGDQTTADEKKSN